MTTDPAHAFAGPAWDNSTEYPSLQSPELAADLERAQQLIKQVGELAARLAPLVPRAASLNAVEAAEAVRVAQQANGLQEQASVLLSNVEIYISCALSVDAKDAVAKSLYGKAQATGAALGQAYNAVTQFLKLTTEEICEAYLATPTTMPQRFAVQQERLLREQTLSLPEEDMLIQLDVNGPLAWGNLYDNLSGTIACEVAMPGQPSRMVGLAEAASLLSDERDEARQAAFQATNKGWEAHEESVAGVLNALAGWRLDVYRRRSRKQSVHFLDGPLHAARMSRETLDAMMAAVREAAPLGRKVLALQAQVLGKDRLGPWDLFAPCPQVGETTWRKPTFDEAVAIIADSYGGIHPEMGAFVRMMAERRWIEGRVGPTKRPGAYCTHFPKSRTPRVYMTYSGAMRELKTLAHELGHAFHNWVMRDMPLVQTDYPMTLAETASIFGETVVNTALLEQAKSPGDRLSFAWAQAREAESLLLNIPARFAFEKSLYERRRDSTLTAADLKQLMIDSWRDWYGDALSEMDPMFWASKLHFSIAGLSFYNFPYTFGYLFALGVYAQRERLGDGFFPAYVSLLRDTGRMTAEEVAAKHLGADLTRPDFWRQSLAVSRRSVDQLEASVRATKT